MTSGPLLVGFNRPPNARETPDDQKKASVVPVFKKGTLDVLENKQLISQGQKVGKKLIWESADKDVKDRTIINDHQPCSNKRHLLSTKSVLIVGGDYKLGDKDNGTDSTDF